MKTLTTLIGIVAFQCMAFSQSTTITAVPASGGCSITYFEHSQTLMSGDSSRIKCREITITSLPPSTQALTTINIEFGMVGSFTFKKGSDLNLPETRDVYIEDMLTGKIFDLKTTDSYTFNVNRKVPDRFVLHIDKLLSRSLTTTAAK
jgi:hypothetical protein